MPESESEPDPVAEAPARSHWGFGSVRSAWTGGRVRVADARDRLEASRSSNTAIDQALRTLELDNDAGGSVLASAVAFRVFLLAVPYIFVLTMVFGAADALAGQSPSDLARRFGVGGLVAQSVSSAAELSGLSRAVALLGGLVATWLAARSLLRTLRIVHGLVWRIKLPKQRRPLLAVLLVIGVATAGFVLTIAIDRLDRRSIVGFVAGIVVSIVIPAAAWALISLALPHAPHATWQDMIPGAALFGAASFFLHLFTVVWIAHVIQHKSQTYGAIAAALAVLLWTYVLGRIITASAVLNRTTYQRTQPDQ
jgi:uncharacterized BrkB/YihY/UPF0761 family membrane protein